MLRVVSVGVGLLVVAIAAGPARADGPREPPFSWTGFYLGVNVGQAWRNATTQLADDVGGVHFVSDLLPPRGFHVSGFVGGGQIGHNWRLAGRWVAGFEVDFQHSAVDGDSSSESPDVGFVLNLTQAQDLKWFGTLRGRLGFLATDRLLLFGTGGLAFGHTEASASIANISGVPIQVFGPPLTFLCPAHEVCLADSASRTSLGGVIGAGFEYALWHNVTLKAEYLYLDLGDQTLRLVTHLPAAGNAAATATFDNTFHIVRAGLNVKF
jgi:outer membrane immunogenic protein